MKKIVIILLVLLLVITGCKEKKEEEIQEQMCTVRFDTIGGSVIEEQEIKCGSKIDAPNNPEKEGFDFISWQSVGEKYDFDKNVESDIVLIAEWAKKEGIETVVVSFNTNGGTLISPIEVAKGFSISAPITPKKKGYKFIEWDYDGKKFDYKSKIEKNITLVAKWEESKEESESNATNTKTSKSDSEKESSSNNSNNCSTTSSGAKSCISMDLNWNSLKGTWYLKGTDDVSIMFSEDSSNYIYKGTRFDFHPSKVNYIGGQGGTLPKNIGYTATSIALSINITDITSSSITIDNKYTFYKQKNYPSHIESDLEKLYKDLEGTWYLEGYYKDVYVKFTRGVRYDEKVLYYEENNFCAKYGKAYSQSCYGTTYYSYYYLENSLSGISSNGWSYSSGILYNSSSGTKLKFSKTPTSTSVTGISLNKNNLNLTTGESDKLVATIKPDNATNKKIIWSSNDNTIVSVTNGNIVAHKAGTAIITATTEDGNKSATCTVTVSNISVSSISLSQTNLNLIKGNVQTLTATITPNNATNKSIDWSSSDFSVATVYNGKVTAKKAGTAIITATTEDGNKSATCTVTVSNPPLTASGSIGVKTTVSSSSGISKGINVSIDATGGTYAYTYFFIKLYKDGNLIGETTDTSSNSLFVTGYSTGQYTAEYEVRDNSGTSYKGQIGTTTIS